MADPDTRFNPRGIFMLPVGTILWAENRPGDHNDHLHVEPPLKKTGTPPLSNPGRSPGIQVIYDALVVQFGPTKYFQESGQAAWTHMGGWNRRKIAGTNTWSQHAWWNALDIGPYIGVAAQQKFYDFLTGVTPPVPPPEENVMLPIDDQSPIENIRMVQGRLGVADNGNWDAATVTAVKALAVRANTGDPIGKAGNHVNGRMWNKLTAEFIAANSSGSSGMNDAQVREIVSETGRTLFVEKGQPVVIRGT